MPEKMKADAAENQPKVEETKCPNCGGPLVYDISNNTLTCSYCGSKIDTGYWEDHKISGFDFEDLESHAMQEDAEEIPVYNCVSCGAEILAAKEEVSLTCPYCRNNIVLTDKVSGKLRPNAIVPFKITPDALPQHLNAFYKDKVLLPKKFFSESTLGKITGIYVPFWSFTGDVSGDLSYKGEINSHYSTKNEDVTVTREYKLLRNAKVSFKDLILDASEKMDDAQMDSITPFDLSEAKDFNMAYLAGYAADRFDVYSDTLSGRAEERMRKSAYSAVYSQASSGYSNVKLTGGALAAKMQEVLYILLPVYVFDIAFHGKKYHFAMNGQTGKVVGEVPTDKITCREYMLKRAAVIFAVLMAIFVLGYFLGV